MRFADTIFRNNAANAMRAAFVIMILIASGGCGGGGSEISGLLPGPMIHEVTGDTIPPAPVSSLTASQDDGVVALAWNYPWNPEMKGVLIRRATVGWPDDPDAPETDSDLIVYKGLIHTYTDSGLAHRTAYFYSAFTYDAAGNYADPAHASATAVFQPYTFVAVPDTQYYTLDYPNLLNTMMSWVVDAENGFNVKFLLHEGDITHTNSRPEWENASTSFEILDGNMPYSFCYGNHDESGGIGTVYANEYLPVSRYENTSTFGGVFEEGMMDNTYHLFSAGGTDWMVVSLEYNPRDEALEWANEITAANQDRKVIILTHAFLSINNERSGIGNNIWDKYAKNHANILFVFNGHYLGEDGGRLVSTGDNGNKVYQMFANYQNLALGGLGYMRVVTMDPDDMSVTVKTYSPYLNKYKEEDVNQFSFSNVDFGQ